MKINDKIYWLFLLVVGLIIMVLPQITLAQEVKVDLTLRLVSGNYSVTAGEDNAFFLEIRNAGTKAITNIRLSADKPEGWVVEFRPGEIAYLSPGSLQTIDVNIKPDSKSPKGGYNITLIAEANEIRKVEPVWVNVETASFWVWIGASVAAIAVAAFVFIFLRFGRAK